MAHLDGFEFLLPVFQPPTTRLRLPDRFAQALGGHAPHALMLWEASHPDDDWKVELILDDDGRLCLGRGWMKFVDEYSVEISCFLTFKFDCEDELSVKIFDGTMCRVRFGDDSGGDDEGSSGADE